MPTYLTHLLSDITHAIENVDWPFIKKDEADIHEWITEEEEERTAPIRKLEEWTGIRKEQLPPVEMLSDEQVRGLLEALKKMLDAYNWAFVLQTEVPERIQYVALRENFDQEAKVKQWYHGFFETCRAGTVHKQCALGEYCQCAFYAELHRGFMMRI